MSPKQLKKRLSAVVEEDPSSEPQTLLIDATASHRIFENLLTTYYVPLEIWYIRTIIDKVRISLAATCNAHSEECAGSSTFTTRHVTISCDDHRARRRFLHPQNCPIPSAIRRVCGSIEKDVCSADRCHGSRL